MRMTRTPWGINHNIRLAGSGFKGSAQQSGVVEIGKWQPPVFSYPNSWRRWVSNFAHLIQIEPFLQFNLEDERLYFTQLFRQVEKMWGLLLHFQIIKENIIEWSPKYWQKYCNSYEDFSTSNDSNAEFQNHYLLFDAYIHSQISWASSVLSWFFYFDFWITNCKKNEI